MRKMSNKHVFGSKLFILIYEKRTILQLLCGKPCLLLVKTGELEVIPCTWRYSDTECYFPTHLKNEEERLEKVKNCVPPVPKRNFKKYPVKYIYGTGTERTYARR